MTFPKMTVRFFSIRGGKNKMFKDLTQRDYLCYFGCENPRFSKLPHLVFEADWRAAVFLRILFNCPLAIWPMSPRFSSKGELDPNEWDNLKLADLWHEWENPFNQIYILECCHDQTGIFESNTAIVVSSEQKIELLKDLWNKIENNKAEADEVFNLAPDLTECAGWFLYLLYEQHKFLIVAQEKYRTKIELFKTMLEFTFPNQQAYYKIR